MRKLVIVGGSPRVQAQVRAALAPELGRSLLRVSGGDLTRRAAVIPDVISLRFDRAYPHTLRVRVTSSAAVMLLRRAADTWVVSARGRVMRNIGDPRELAAPHVGSEGYAGDRWRTLGRTEGRSRPRRSHPSRRGCSREACGLSALTRPS